MRSVCIIPARGGSKRIPRKNILPLNGIPLLAYTIRAAKGADVFDHIIVSSEDPDVVNVAIDEGVEIDHRPERMAGDTITKVQVVKEYLERTHEQFDVVAALLPTCPFRTAEDVRGPYEMFTAQNEHDFLVGVVEYDFPIQLALKPNNGNIMEMVDERGYDTTRSQNIEKRYHPNGAIYLAKVSAFLEKGTFFNTEMMTYEMPPERSWDIDYPWQLAIAEGMAKRFADE